MGTAPPLHGRPLRPSTGHRIELCIYVDDVDEAAEALRATGAPVVLEPNDQPWASAWRTSTIRMGTSSC